MQDHTKPELSVLGAINWDISIFVDRFASPGEEVVVTSVEEFSGGKGGNVAVAAARILGKNRVSFIGALGKDRISEIQINEFIKEGVDYKCIEFIENVGSGCAYIIVDKKGKKQINTYFGANKLLSKEHIQKTKVRRTIKESKLVVIMDIPKEAALAVSEIVRENKVPFIYSPGVMVREGVEFIKEVSEKSKYIVLDSFELMNLYSESLESSLSKAENDFYSSIVTVGELGCYIIRAGERKLIKGYRTTDFNGSVANTTGCGDAFLGVFSSYLIEKYEDEICAKLANLAGAIKATRIETRGSPRREELEEIFEKIEGIKLPQHKGR